MRSSLKLSKEPSAATPASTQDISIQSPFTNFGMLFQCASATLEATATDRFPATVLVASHSVCTLDPMFDSVIPRGARLFPPSKNHIGDESVVK